MSTAMEGMTDTPRITENILDEWATSTHGPVALHVKQQLLPVESEEGVVFPPTYANIGYNWDTLSDGTKMAMIDNVGSQANRMEPIFMTGELAALVPQIEIKINDSSRYSLLQLPHRSADAVVRSTPELLPEIEKAFKALRDGDAWPLCSIAPTSLVFGVWDSRGTSVKRPRLVRAIIRAWDVELFHAAAQFNSVWKALNEEQQDVLRAEAKGKNKFQLSDVGLADVPAVFRPDNSRVLGGVLAKGRIDREVTVNLVALRGLVGRDEQQTEEIRKYLLGLSLLAATSDIDMFLREGCNLRYKGEDEWYSVPRRGEPQRVDLVSEEARGLILQYATAAAESFKLNWPKSREFKFDVNEAKKLLAKKKSDENPAEGN